VVSAVVNTSDLARGVSSRHHPYLFPEFRERRHPACFSSRFAFDEESRQDACAPKIVSSGVLECWSKIQQRRITA